MGYKYVISGPARSINFATDTLSPDWLAPVEKDARIWLGDLYSGSAAFKDRFGLESYHNNLLPHIQLLVSAIHRKLSDLSTGSVAASNEMEYVQQIISGVIDSAHMVDPAAQLSNSTILWLCRMEFGGQLRDLQIQYLLNRGQGEAAKYKSLVVRLASELCNKKFTHRMLDKFALTRSIPTYGIKVRPGRIDCIAPEDLSQDVLDHIECTLRRLRLVCRVYESDPSDDVDEIRASVKDGILPGQLSSRAFQQVVLDFSAFPKNHLSPKAICKALADQGITGPLEYLGNLSDTDLGWLMQMPE